MSMEHDATIEVVGQAVKHGFQGGLMGAAASVVSGAAVGCVTTTTPIRILWGLLTIGTATVTTPIWLPGVIAAAAVGGAVIAGTAGAAAACRRIQALDAEWAAICDTDEDD